MSVKVSVKPGTGRVFLRNPAPFGNTPPLLGNGFQIVSIQ